MRSKAKTPTSGFTLLEVLVAFIILGLATGGIMSIFRSSPMNVARSENERLATMAAQSVMASAGTERPLESSSQQGQMPGGVNWAMSIEPYQSSEAFLTEAYLVSVNASVGTGIMRETAELKSIRLKKVTPE